MGELKQLRPVNTPDEEYIFLNPIKPKSLEYVSKRVALLISEGWAIGSVESVVSHDSLYLICLIRREVKQP